MFEDGNEGFSGSNLLGFNGREAKLADRVREVEEQNQLLRRQLRYVGGECISYALDVPPAQLKTCEELQSLVCLQI